MEQEDPFGKDLETSYSNPCRPQVAHVKPGFLSLLFSILALIRNLLTSINFFPLCLPLCVSYSDAPLQPEILLPPDAASLPASRSLLTQLSHTTLMPSLRRHAYILFCLGLPHQSGFSRRKSTGLLPLVEFPSSGTQKPSSPPMTRKSISMTG